MAWGLVVALLLGGGTSYMAETSLPDEILYPVKVNINEPARGLLSFSAADEAAWRSEQVERRLSEIEKLVEGGRLTDEAKAAIEGRFAAAAGLFVAAVGRLENQNNLGKAIESQSNFEAALRAHAEIIAQLRQRDEAHKIRLQSIYEEILARAEAARKDRINIEDKVSGFDRGQFITAAEGKRTAAERKIVEVRNFVDHFQLNMEDMSRVEEQLKLASDKIMAGNVAVDNQTYGQAFSAFQEALRLAQEIKLWLDSKDLKPIR